MPARPLFWQTRSARPPRAFREESLTLQNLFNAAANNAKQLADIKERVAALVPAAKQMAANSFEGVDPGKFSQLAAKTAELEQTLDKLSQTKDYIEIFDSPMPARPVSKPSWPA